MSKRTRREEKAHKTGGQEEEEEEPEQPVCFICKGTNRKAQHKPVCTKRRCVGKEFVHTACLDRKFVELKVNVIQHECCQCEHKVRFEKSDEQKQVELMRDSGLFAVMFILMSTMPFLVLHWISPEKFSVPEGSLLQYLTVPLFSWTVCGMLFAVGKTVQYCLKCFWFPVARLYNWTFRSHTAVLDVAKL